jgi:hypothetical protein
VQDTKTLTHLSHTNTAIHRQHALLSALYGLKKTACTRTHAHTRMCIHARAYIRIHTPFSHGIFQLHQLCQRAGRQQGPHTHTQTHTHTHSYTTIRTHIHIQTHKHTHRERLHSCFTDEWPHISQRVPDGIDECLCASVECRFVNKRCIC